MRRRALLVASVALAGCGPGARGDGFEIALVVQAGLLDTLAGFQVAVVTDGHLLDCSVAQGSCIAGQVAASRFLPIRDGTGAAGHSVFFPLQLVAGTPNTQDVSVTNVPPGKDYAVIVEALSKDTPPLLAGASCSYAPQVSVGLNPAITAHLQTLAPAKSCATAIP